ncbi:MULTISPECIES: TetR/AcrR family transcriptional regulator [Nocardia]|uniref:HTH-type transcriptional repressor KstR n=1 Tax=Nocardia africana TaxID=134964 RepID=A0A378WHD2_9NOCA|nr:TetR/AcrR family transcriptional regulator [Nocardia africana]MCC3317965.1 TetR family transcriptional regulator [Nocardia africana]SUA40690.1 HTH-type transcriptional repressor KstR [Nocardia africana]
MTARDQADTRTGPAAPQPPAGEDGEDLDQADPRLARSRARLLDAATHLLATGGIDAVTIDAVTRTSKVARTTLYRHFGSSTHLLAATFERLLPRVDTPPDDGPVRERLIALLTAQADLIENTPIQLTTLAWLAMGSIPAEPADTAPDSAAVTSLRAQVIRRYREPFDHILTSPEARTLLGDLDTTFAIIQLLGPIVFARLTGLRGIDHHDRVRLVDDFLAAHHTHPSHE